ncbi:unnamed protein product [Pleuronectes platessa]|uniref:Uncharacterized protein n=1 Tax=Pleuronectes platessa TaxID=8262 RepID=A0A9N7Z3X4_PLEPL|nr:unnamed protein product [Pleuronectes platessa]
MYVCVFLLNSERMTTLPGWRLDAAFVFPFGSDVTVSAAVVTDAFLAPGQLDLSPLDAAVLDQMIVPRSSARCLLIHHNWESLLAGSGSSSGPGLKCRSSARLPQ